MNRLMTLSIILFFRFCLRRAKEVNAAQAKQELIELQAQLGDLESLMLHFESEQEKEVQNLAHLFSTAKLKRFQLQREELDEQQYSISLFFHQLEI